VGGLYISLYCIVFVLTFCGISFVIEEGAVRDVMEVMSKSRCKECNGEEKSSSPTVVFTCNSCQHETVFNMSTPWQKKRVYSTGTTAIMVAVLLTGSTYEQVYVCLIEDFIVGQESIFF